MSLGVLEPYFEQMKRCRSLPQYHCHLLEHNPILPNLIRQTVGMLAELEVQQGKEVRMSRQRMFRLLLERHPELFAERYIGLVSDDRGPVVRLKGRTAVRFPDFNQAMTIAKRVGLITGWGRGCGLHSEISRKLRQAAESA